MNNLWEHFISLSLSFITQSASAISITKDCLVTSFLYSIESRATLPSNILRDLSSEDCISYFYHQYDDPFEFADVVVECNLEYVETKDINISETGTHIMKYDVYNIVNYSCEKGELICEQLKVPYGLQVPINENDKYKLYLQQYDFDENLPCSLINPQQGIENI